MKSHSEQRSHVCPDCDKGFTRGDLLTRHRTVHTKHTLTGTGRQRTTKACQACISAKAKCTEERPCARCEARSEPCVPTKQRTRVLDRFDGKSVSSSTASMEPIVSRLEHDHQHNSGLLSYQDMASFDVGEGLDDFEFPSFFDQIMNMPPGDTQDPSMVPPNVSNFTSDDFGFMDYDFGLLAGGLTRPPSAQGLRKEPSLLASLTSSQSDAQLRSDAFERSPWSWNHWIPTKSHSTFSGQEINVTEQRIASNDQLTPGDRDHPILAMDLEARDRILRLVTSVAASRLSISSFPSPDLLSDLLNVFVLQEREAIDSYVHCSSLNCRETRTELLLALLAKGATFVALQPVWQIGLVFQEIVRIGTGDTFERDNSTTRQLQPLQAYIIHLDVGLWSGFRRKTEIASSFLQPGATMLTWSDAFRKYRYRDIIPSENDDTTQTEAKWKAWIEQESLKRLVLHVFIHDSQASLAHSKDPLLSPSRMQLPLPASLELWQAQDAQSWRTCYLSKDRPNQSEMPSVVALSTDLQLLHKHGRIIDQGLCVMLACHLIAYDVLQHRQQATVLAGSSGSARNERWLAHTNRQKEIYEDLTSMHTYCQMLDQPMPEIEFSAHYLMMLLHTSFEDIQLFSGRSGESEARRVFPLIRVWTEGTESRVAVWHAGQALRAARSLEKTRLRDFYAVALHHVTLTLWVYGMVTSNVARASRAHTPAVQPVPARQNANIAREEDVLLDGEDGRRAKAFRHLGQGRPCLSVLCGPQNYSAGDARSSSALAKVCPLESPKEVMLLASRVLEDNFPNSCSGLPPLVDNLVKLMVELSRFSGRDGG